MGASTSACCSTIRTSGSSTATPSPSLVRAHGRALGCPMGARHEECRREAGSLETLSLNVAVGASGTDGPRAEGCGTREVGGRGAGFTARTGPLHSPQEAGRRGAGARVPETHSNHVTSSRKDARPGAAQLASLLLLPRAAAGARSLCPSARAALKSGHSIGHIREPGQRHARFSPALFGCFTLTQTMPLPAPCCALRGISG